MFTQEQTDNLVEQGIKKSKGYLADSEFINAETLLKQILRVAPESQQALEMLGLVYINKNKPEDAILVYEKLLQLDQNNYDGLNNLAICCSMLGKYEEAIELLEKGLELYPDKPSLYWNLALQWESLNDMPNADLAYQTGIKTLPDCPDLRYNYAVFLTDNGQYQESLYQYDEAIRLKPNHAKAHWNKGLTLLLLDDYTHGFKEYEWRWQVIPAFEQIRIRHASKPEWQGESNISLLIYNEQGHGDIIQHIRFLPMLKEKGIKTIVEVPQALVDLVSQCAGLDKVIPWRGKETPEYDYHISFSSLPLLLKTTIETIPYNFPYIKPTGSIDKDCFKNYEDMFKIGICWAGSPYHRFDHKRSCELKEFRILHDIPNVKLFSLQKETAKRFWTGRGVIDMTEGCDDMSIVNMSDLLLDFNYTAAIIEQLDLIITVDTAIAHLAGAMNKPCWLILPNHNDWRWGIALAHNNNRTHWYDSIRTFRQTQSGNWQEVFERMAKEINVLHHHQPALTV